MKSQSDLLDILLDLATPEASLQLYAHEQRGQWPKAVRFLPFGDDPHEYAAKNTDKNVYFNCCLMAEVKKGRGDGDDARILPFLYADLDAREGKHHGERAPKKELAEMLKSGDVVPVPSIVVDSGGGLHAYWVLETPFRIRSKDDKNKAEGMLLELNNRIRDWHVKKGYHYERLKDLARVLRVPGTFNHKTDPPIGVKTLWPKDVASPKRYTTEELTFKEETTEQPANNIAPEFDAVETDQAECQRLAVSACMKIEPEWNNDASSYVVKCCRQCVRYGCTAETAVKVIRAMDAIHGLPKKWSDAEIIKRFKDAGEQSKSGEAIRPKTFTNYTLNQDGKTVPKDQGDLLTELDSLGLDLVCCRGELVLIRGETFESIARDSTLFAHIQSRASTRWKQTECISKLEFFEATKGHVPKIDEIELTPHFPPLPHRRYLTPLPKGRDTSELERFLDLFKPETSLDRQLILAGIATVCWGGPPGKRPAFAVETLESDSRGGVGSGKSSVVELVASVPQLGQAGGIISVRNRSDWNRLISNMQDVSTGSSRVVFFDNVKATLEGQEIESMVTSAIIDGHKMYKGHSSRTNRFTWFITANGLTTSIDMASRLIPIRILRPKNDPQWEAIRQSIDHYKVLEGVAAFFGRPTKKLADYSRWQLWEQEVLSRCDDPDDICQLIASRRGGLTSVDDDAAEIRQRVTQLLAGWDGQDYNADADYCFIPAQKMADVLTGWDGQKSVSAKACKSIVRRCLVSPYLAELDFCRDTSLRGYIWRGIASGNKQMDRDRFAVGRAV